MILAKVIDSRSKDNPERSITLETALELFEGAVSAKRSLVKMVLFCNNSELISFGWEDQNLEPVSSNSFRIEFRPHGTQEDFNRLRDFVNQNWP